MENQFLSINFHLLEACNARCGFCFAKYGNSKAIISRNEAMEIIKQVAAVGIQKITFAGGEPLLYPNLNVLIRYAKQCGLTTMLVSNGMRLNSGFLDEMTGSLDWVGISIDSFDAKTNLAIGRAEPSSLPISADDYIKLTNEVKERDMGLKVNTVVNAFNVHENLASIIEPIQPIRWKIMKAIFNAGANDKAKRIFDVTDEEFADFVIRNKVTNNNIKVVAEPEELMRGSYLMIDPQGRLYDSSNGCHRFSSKIIEVGISKALEQVSFDITKFTDRNGSYDWNITANTNSFNSLLQNL
jgi:radical S-adenosyl methionine domain-containing protein 2